MRAASTVEMGLKAVVESSEEMVVAWLAVPRAAPMAAEGELVAPWAVWTGAAACPVAVAMQAAVLVDRAGMGYGGEGKLVHAQRRPHSGKRLRREMHGALATDRPEAAYSPTRGPTL